MTSEISPEIRMSPNPALVSGLVHDENGQPVPMARVFFVSGPGSLPDIAALTDDHGAFTVSVGLSGTYQLQCVADGFHPTKLEVFLSGGHTAHVMFQLTRSR